MNSRLFNESKIQALVERVIARANAFSATAASNRNITDPFAAALESALFGLRDKADWEALEIHRQKQKNLMNHIGLLHQGLIGCLDGWESFDAGSDKPDIIGRRGNQKIIGEVKNKHNTMNARSAEATYDKISYYLEQPQYHGHVGVIVQILGTDHNNGTYWRNFSAGSNRPVRDDILVMSGRVFYAIATDAERRQPNRDFKANLDLRRWPSWPAYEMMAEELFSIISSTTNFEIPDWVKELFRGSL